MAPTAASGSSPDSVADRGDPDFTHRPVNGRMPGQSLANDADLASPLGNPQSWPPRGSLPLGAEIHQSSAFEPFRAPERIGLKGARRRATDAQVFAAIRAGEKAEAPPERRSCRVVVQEGQAFDYKPRPVRKGAGKGPRNRYRQPGMMRL